MAKLNSRQILSFWKRVRKGGKDECWNWAGAASAKGYGRVKFSGKLHSPHRIAYELANGKIPKLDRQYHQAVVMHKCDNPRCCNPNHLIIGTQRDNVRDMHRKKRAPECHWKTPKEVERQILDCPLPSRRAAEKFGVSKNTVLRIRRQAA